jgi:hypothetical protein
MYPSKRFGLQSSIEKRDFEFGSGKAEGGRRKKAKPMEPISKLT